MPPHFLITIVSVDFCFVLLSVISVSSVAVLHTSDMGSGMTEYEQDPLTERIIGAAIEVHRLLGPGLLESIYEQALEVELQLRGIPCQRQVDVQVIYKDHVIKGQKIDMIVAQEVIVEVKSLSKLPEVATAQLLSYLKSTGLKRGLLLNFGCPRLVDGIKRLSR